MSKISSGESALREPCNLADLYTGTTMKMGMKMKMTTVSSDAQNIHERSTAAVAIANEPAWKPLVPISAFVMQRSFVP